MYMIPIPEMPPHAYRPIYEQSISMEEGQAETFTVSDFLSTISKLDKGCATYNIGSSAWNSDTSGSAINNIQKSELLEAALEAIHLENDINNRLITLKCDGTSEGISCSKDSESFLRKFFKNHSIKNRPSIFLLENGNFRILWKNGLGEQIGLQFLNSGDIQYVMFARRVNRTDLARSYGSDTPEGIDRLIEANRLRSLLYP